MLAFGGLSTPLFRQNGAVIAILGGLSHNLFRQNFIRIYSESIRIAGFIAVIQPRWGCGVMGDTSPLGFASLNPGLPLLSRFAALSSCMMACAL